MLWHHIIYGDSHFSSRTSSLLSVCASFVVRHSSLSTAARCTEHNFCRVACYCRRRRLLFEPNKQDTTTTRKKKYRGIIHALRMIINKFRNLVFTHTRHTHAAPYAWHPLNLELFRSRVLNVSRGSQCWRSPATRFPRARHRRPLLFWNIYGGGSWRATITPAIKTVVRCIHNVQWHEWLRWHSL